MMTPNLTLEEQVGQVVVAVCPGDPEALAPLVALGRVGGLVIPPGISGAEGRLAAALSRLQRLATYPLLCLVDAEGGLGPHLPGAPALAAARRPDLARRAGALAAAEARARGAGLVLAPPLDVLREPGRRAFGPCFGDNPSLVARLGAAFVEGCREAGALAVGRYFPGRGGAEIDAESGLAVVPQGRSTLEKIDLLPYVAACRAGLDAIMTGHLHVAALDTLPTRLATHSSAVVEGLLRGTLQFQGLLLTDNLDAPAVRARYGAAEAAVLAFAAGHDLVLSERPAEVYRALYEVLLNGDIPLTRLQEAVGRIWAAKAWLEAERHADMGSVGTETIEAQLQAGPELAREVARAALTVVRGRRELVAGPQPLLVAHRLARPDGSRFDDDLRRLAADCLPQAPVHVLDARPRPEQLEAVLDAARATASALLFLDLPPGSEERSRPAEATVALAQALKRAGLAVGVALVGSPQALARFPGVDLLLYLPGDDAAGLAAAFAYLNGEFEAAGRLPVMMPGLG
jgi:beta-N-acetylhexosaminidase